MHMTVGLTYDLRSEYLARGYSEEETAELDRDDTVAAIEEAVQRAGHATVRIGSAGALAERLSKNQRWDLVFNICEGLYGLGRESLVPAMLDAHRIPYTFSDPAVLAVSLHKALTKRVMRDLGVPTPDFAVIERPEDVDAVKLAYPLFAKPLAEGTGKGIGPTSKITTPAALRKACAELLERFHQPVLVEEYLPGREFTAGVVGTGADAEVIGVMEVILLENAEADAYSYVNKEYCDDKVAYRPAEGDLDRECREVTLQAWRGLGCRDGGRIDLRVARDGKVSFIEVNPLAGLHPQHSDLPIICTMFGVTFQQLIERILASAAKRVSARTST
jgi:D-alanine-D-alanine ligase